MNNQIAGAVTHRWRDRLNQQLTPESTSQQVLRVMYVLWLLAFLFKHGGSSWDVAWHFRYPFGMTEPPHIVNAFGSLIAAGLLVFQTMTGQATDRTGLSLMQVGFVIFALSIPLDFANHIIFGLDVTVWSPTHILGFAATTLLLIGTLYSWLKLATPGRWRTWVAFGFWAFLVDDMLFMLSQQEYGVVALDAYSRGHTSASPELLALAGRNPELFVEGGIPHWVYPLWMILTSTLVLLAARRIQHARWTATIVALLYLAYRMVGWLALGMVDFPQSFVPVMLLLAAFVIDLSEDRHWQPWLLALALVSVYYSSALLIGRYTLMPEFALSTAPVALLALWGGLLAARWWNQRGDKIAMQAA